MWQKVTLDPRAMATSLRLVALGVAGAAALVGSPVPRWTGRTRRRSVDAAAIFDVLGDARVLVDPSGGTCCRNECGSCAYHSEGAYAYDELEGGRWLPVAPAVAVPPRAQIATWARRSSWVVAVRRTWGRRFVGSSLMPGMMMRFDS